MQMYDVTIIEQVERVYRVKARNESEAYDLAHDRPADDEMIYKQATYDIGTLIEEVTT